MGFNLAFKGLSVNTHSCEIVDRRSRLSEDLIIKLVAVTIQVEREGTKVALFSCWIVPFGATRSSSGTRACTEMYLCESRTTVTNCNKKAVQLWTKFVLMPTGKLHITLTVHTYQFAQTYWYI